MKEKEKKELKCPEGGFIFFFFFGLGSLFFINIANINLLILIC